MFIYTHGVSDRVNNKALSHIQLMPNVQSRDKVKLYLYLHFISHTHTNNVGDTEPSCYKGKQNNGDLFQADASPPFRNDSFDFTKRTKIHCSYNAACTDDRACK